MRRNSATTRAACPHALCQRIKTVPTRFSQDHPILKQISVATLWAFGATIGDPRLPSDLSSPYCTRHCEDAAWALARSYPQLQMCSTLLHPVYGILYSVPLHDCHGSMVSVGELKSASVSIRERAVRRARAPESRCAGPGLRVASPTGESVRPGPGRGSEPRAFSSVRERNRPDGVMRIRTVSGQQTGQAVCASASVWHPPLRYTTAFSAPLSAVRTCVLRHGVGGAQSAARHTTFTSCTVTNFGFQSRQWAPRSDFGATSRHVSSGPSESLRALAALPSSASQSPHTSSQCSLRATASNKSARSGATLIGRWAPAWTAGWTLRVRSSSRRCADPRRRGVRSVATANNVQSLLNVYQGQGMDEPIS